MRTPTLATLAALSLAGCSSGPFGPSESSLPDCQDVWVEGEQLPEDYGGCRDNGQAVEPEVYHCVKDVGAELVTFGESKKPTATIFYAVRGDKIFKIEKEPFTSTSVGC